MPQDNRLIIALGVALAVVAAVIAAMLLTGKKDPNPEPPPASKGGLQLDVADAPTLNPEQELRCFVNGQYVGMATLADCAQRNGVATNALDVGVDQSGNLTAAEVAAFNPPPSLEGVSEIDPSEFQEPGIQAPAPQPSQPTQPSRPSAPTAPCLAYVGDSWRELGGMAMGTCVQQLFSGSCLRPGEARYGRWGNTTLRLVPRRVEQSPNNQDFRTLVEQNRDCTIPAVG